jgi:glutathione S-transferase
MIIIYHIEGRRSERVAWLMEELGLDYELSFVPMEVVGSWEAIKAVHPLGWAPTIRDGDLWLFESSAIIEYIIARHGEGRFGVRPEQSDFPAYVQWVHAAEGSVMGRLMTEGLVKPFLTDDWLEKAPQLMVYLGAPQRMMEFIEKEMAGRSYFAGADFTAADIMMEMPVRMGLKSLGAGQFPDLAAWHERVTDRPAFQRMLERALPNGQPPHIGGWPQKEVPA